MNEQMRAVLVAIQELHKPVSYWYVSGYDETLYDSKEDAEGESAGGRVYEHKACDHCIEYDNEYETEATAWPCETRKLADQGLGGGQDG